MPFKFAVKLVEFAEVVHGRYITFRSGESSYRGRCSRMLSRHPRRGIISLDPLESGEYRPLMLNRLIVSAKAHLPESAIDVLRELRHRGKGLRDVLFSRLGYRLDQWVRVVQIDEWKVFLTGLPLARLAALEISPGDKTVWRQIGFGSYTAVDFPTFDITKETLPCAFDVIIAEQVFEHLRHPYAAARNVRTMLKDDGIFLIATPFLIRVHDMPQDYTRWTPDGLSGFLEDCGFHAEVRSWGSRKAVTANFNRWAEFGFGRSLRNEPDFPAVVWAYARKKSA